MQAQKKSVGIEAKNELIDIIDRLIDYFALKSHSHDAVESNSEKIEQLNKLKKLISAEKFMARNEIDEEYRLKINNICQIKHNVVHLWSKPHQLKNISNKAISIKD